MKHFLALVLASFTLIQLLMAQPQKEFIDSLSVEADTLSAQSSPWYSQILDILGITVSASNLKDGTSFNKVGDIVLYELENERNMRLTEGASFRSVAFSQDGQHILALEADTLFKFKLGENYHLEEVDKMLIPHVLKVLSDDTLSSEQVYVLKYDVEAQSYFISISSFQSDAPPQLLTPQNDEEKQFLADLSKDYRAYGKTQLYVGPYLEQLSFREYDHIMYRKGEDSPMDLTGSEKVNFFGPVMSRNNQVMFIRERK